MPFRLALLTPFGPPAVRGNAVTVSRIAQGLGERGVEVCLWDLSAASAPTIESEVEAYRPALIHAFHAYRVGPLALGLAQRVEAPLVVTLTGTDANHDLFDPERAASVRRVLGGAGRITVFHPSVGEHVGEVPHSQMASLLSQADVVLNCSISEGGMANSVLEALSLGRAVLASDIDGNRSIITDGATGFLFRDEAEFERRAALLARDPALRERLGRAGCALVAERFPPPREIDGYCDVYRELIPS